MQRETGSDPTAGNPVLTGGPSPRILWLDEPAAADPGLTGAKAANLAAARLEGLPVYDGFVLTTYGTSALEHADAVRASVPDAPLRRAWRTLSADGARRLAVRSSSSVEDSTTSSMAGRFVSVLHVDGWDAFVDATFEVIDSAASTELGDAPMAVLVQPMADALVGGVLFGLDPLSGDRRTLSASMADGLPDQIVSGTTTGTQVSIGRRGRLRRQSGPLPRAFGRKHLRALAALARATERHFGQPQDMEWLIDAHGELKLLQSRPITASALPPEHSHLLGPGPVAETFPDPLSALERDLWLPPLDDGIREALRISGGVSQRTLGERFVVDVAGRVAVDLEALGVHKPRRRWWHAIDPRPPARQLRVAWRIGRLRSALPAIAHDLVEEVDADLAEVPALDQLGDLQLMTVLDNARQTLASLHAYEVVSGFFLDDDTDATTGASMALSTVNKARRLGLDDEAIVAEHPVALALVPPRIGTGRPLPPSPPIAVPAPARAREGRDDDATGLAREALRLRVRWVQELTARTALEVGSRLAERGQLADAHRVRLLPLVEVQALLADPSVTATAISEDPTVAPLPARFRLARDGTVVPDLSADRQGPMGVSSGRVEAVVTHRREAAAGKILVIPALDPALAGVLGEVAGLVAETGSPLSHLAILAREFGVPAVVGVADATEAHPEGSRVLLDGAAGTIDVIGTADVTHGPHDDPDPHHHPSPAHQGGMAAFARLHAATDPDGTPPEETTP